MDPTDNDIAKENAKRLWHLLIELNNRMLSKQVLKVNRIARVKGTCRRPKWKCPQTSGATVLPEHSSASKLKPLDCICSIKKIRILLMPALVNAKFVKLLVENIHENVGYTRA